MLLLLLPREDLSSLFSLLSSPLSSLLRRSSLLRGSSLLSSPPFSSLLSTPPRLLLLYSRSPLSSPLFSSLLSSLLVSPLSSLLSSPLFLSQLSPLLSPLSSPLLSRRASLQDLRSLFLFFSPNEGICTLPCLRVFQPAPSHEWTKGFKAPLRGWGEQSKQFHFWETVRHRYYFPKRKKNYFPKRKKKVC